MELGRQQGPPVFLNAMSCSRSPQCWFSGALRHPRRFPGILWQQYSLAGFLHIWGPIPGQRGGSQELEGAAGLPSAPTSPYCGPCISLWRAHNDSQTSAQIVFSFVSPGCVTVRPFQCQCLSWGEVPEGGVGRLSRVSLTAFGAERSDPRHAIVVPAVILLSRPVVSLG